MKRIMAIASAIFMTLLLIPAGSAVAEDSRPAGVVQPSEAFAGLPFPKRVAPDLRMSSGWFIAEDEKKIVGEGHKALDFEGPVCGTPILAIADGRAVASYQSGVERGGTAPFDPANPSDTSTDWRDPVTGKEGWLGYSGLFVELQTEVQIPGFQKVVAQYFHLAAVNPRITWLDPVRLDDTVTWDGKHVANWYPQPITQSQDAIYQIATPVKKGDVIGWLGDTGVNFGFNDNFDPQHHFVWPRNRMANPPWDPQGAGATTPIWRSCQLHIQFYSGRTSTGSKLNMFDGFDKYDRITGIPGTPSYHNPDNPQPGKFVMGPNPIFQRDRHGNAVYAG